MHAHVFKTPGGQLPDGDLAIDAGDDLEVDIGAKVDDPVTMYLNDIYTVTADLVGVPGISVPCGVTKANLPIGLQILGKHFDESTVFRVGHAVEHAMAAN